MAIALLPLVLGILFSFTHAQSSIPFAADHATSCLKRSVYVYTSGSSTYAVTNLGQTTLGDSPSFCSNVTTLTSTVFGSGTITTLTAPASTITVEASSTPTAVTNSTINFDAGSATYETAASGSQVTAEVASAGPLQPYSGDSYLLITFDGAATTPIRRRQTTQPQAYNVTQVFPATAGTSYTLSAYASSAQNGNTSPDCSLTICAGTDCSSPYVITSSYAYYSYQYNALAADSNAMATYSVQCAAAAYIALDDISIVAGSTPVASAQPTRTVTQYITQTLGAVTQTEGPVTATTIAWSTATSVIEVPDTQYISLVSTALSTTTTTIVSTTTLNVTQTQDRPTLVYETVTALTTALATVTAYSVSLSVPLASTSTTTQVSTIERTTTLIQPPSIIYETVTALTTAFATVTNYNISLSVPLASTFTTTEISTIERTTTLSQPPTIVYETVTATSTAVLTETLLSLSVSNPDVSTLTTTAITTLQLTTTISELPSLIYETITATETSQVTFTALSISALDASTLTTTELTTLLLTTTIDQTSLVIETETATTTSIITTTEPSSVPYPFTLPRETFTPFAETSLLTTTLDASTVTTLLVITPAPVTETVTSTLPIETTTPPAGTITEIATVGVGYNVESNCPASLETATISARTTYFQPACDRQLQARYTLSIGTYTNNYGNGSPQTVATNLQACLNQCTATTATLISGTITTTKSQPCIFAQWYTYTISSTYSSGTSSTTYTQSQSQCYLGYGKIVYSVSWDPSWQQNVYNGQGYSYTQSSSYIAYVVATTPAAAAASATPV